MKTSTDTNKPGEYNERESLWWNEIDCEDFEPYPDDLEDWEDIERNPGSGYDMP